MCDGFRPSCDFRSDSGRQAPLVHTVPAGQSESVMQMGVEPKFVDTDTTRHCPSCGLTVSGSPDAVCGHFVECKGINPMSTPPPIPTPDFDIWEGDFSRDTSGGNIDDPIRRLRALRDMLIDGAR